MKQVVPRDAYKLQAPSRELEQIAQPAVDWVASVNSDTIGAYASELPVAKGACPPDRAPWP